MSAQLRFGPECSRLVQTLNAPIASALPLTPLFLAFLGGLWGRVRGFKLLHPLFQCTYSLPEFRKPWNHGLGFYPDFMRHHRGS